MDAMVPTFAYGFNPPNTRHVTYVNHHMAVRCCKDIPGQILAGKIFSRGTFPRFSKYMSICSKGVSCPFSRNRCPQNCGHWSISMWPRPDASCLSKWSIYSNWMSSWTSYHPWKTIRASSFTIFGAEGYPTSSAPSEQPGLQGSTSYSASFSRFQ